MVQSEMSILLRCARGPQGGQWPYITQSRSILPCTPLDPPLIIPFLFAVEEIYGTRYQSGSFSLLSVGSGFHCLRGFSLFLFLPYLGLEALLAGCVVVCSL